MTLDVTSAESIDALASQLRHRDGKLHILVNNAGVVATGPLIEADIKEARRLYEVNYFGVLSVTQAFVQMLVEAKGKVVNISSVGALLAVPWIGRSNSVLMFALVWRLRCDEGGWDSLSATHGIRTCRLRYFRNIS